jgi:hypothetical protein
MKTTITKLAMTEFDYEMMIFGFYSRWCESVTDNTRDFQSVLANSSINSWFLMELTKCETEFHQLSNRYTSIDVTALDFKKCYNDCTYRLFSIRPMALLNNVKTTSLIPAYNLLNRN